MQVGAMQIWHDEREKRPLFSGPLYSREALQTYARLRWPTNTAKHAAREWDLSLDEARGICSARSSQSVIDKILKHRNGGWRVALAVFGAVIGRDLDGFLAEEQGRLAREREQFEAQERHLAEMADRARALGAVWLRGPAEPVVRESGQGAELGRELGAGSDRAAVEPTAFTPDQRGRG